MKFIYITSLIVLIFIKPIFGQTLINIEKQYSEVEKTLHIEQIRLDSLNARLNNQVKKINQEKNKKEIDKNSITDLMANSIILTNKIKVRQKLVANIGNKFEEQKRILDAKYESIIDSLEKLKLMQYSPEMKLKVDALIFEFTQKKLIVSPKIYSLSLDPQKILQIDISASEDSIERAIYEEYLINAINEVDSRIVQLKNSKEEIQQIVYLQQKRDDFIDDIDSDFPVEAFAQTENKTTKKEDAFSGYPSSSNDQRSKISAQAQSYGYILSQLKRFINSEIQSTWQTPLDSITVNLTFQQYNQLLVEVEKRLEEYRFVLAHKLDNIK